MSKKRYLMELTVGPQPHQDSEMRNLTPQDSRELGELLWHADQGAFDDEGQSIAESVTELDDTL